MNTIVDARGMACPLPVVKANQALSAMTEGVLEVHVDNAVAVENLKRMAQQKGLTPEVKEVEQNHFVVSMAVKGAVAAGKCLLPAYRWAVTTWWPLTRT